MTDALYHSFWVEGNAKIGQPEGFLPVLERVLGKDGAGEVFKAVCLNPISASSKVMPQHRTDLVSWDSQRYQT